REEVVPGQLLGDVLGAGGATENDDVLDRRRRRDGLIDDRQERNVLPLPVGQVRREERPGAGEPHALAERARAEAREDDEDDHPDADRAEHEDERLSRGRHVDRDAIALHEAHRAKRRPHALGLPVEVGVRERSALATLVLGDQSDVAAASGRDVVVDGVVREVRHAARVPTEGRRLPVEDALPLLEPRQLLGGAAPELLGVVGGLFAPRANGLERIGLAHPEARSRSLKRWIFPVTVLGSSGTNSIQRGYLYGVIRPFTNAFSSSASSSEGWRPFFSRTKAFGLVRSSLSLTPTTPHSSTAGCSISAASTSAGETHWPETFSMSSLPPS